MIHLESQESQQCYAYLLPSVSGMERDIIILKDMSILLPSKMLLRFCPHAFNTFEYPWTGFKGSFKGTGARAFSVAPSKIWPNTAKPFPIAFARSFGFRQCTGNSTVEFPITKKIECVAVFACASVNKALVR
jgi:hypothetical protein